MFEKIIHRWFHEFLRLNFNYSIFRLLLQREAQIPKRCILIIAKYVIEFNSPAIIIKIFYMTVFLSRENPFCGHVK